jgi:hypothetical protein
MENLEQRIQRIEERNAKVELDKKWETSWTRRVLLTLFTYLSVSIYLWAIGISNPWLNAAALISLTCNIFSLSKFFNLLVVNYD